MKKIKDTYHRFRSLMESQPKSSDEALKEEEEIKFIYEGIEKEMGYFYSGLQDRLSRDGILAYCKNKLTVILDNFMLQLLDDIGNTRVAKVYEEICKVKSENFDHLLRIIFTTSY